MAAMACGGVLAISVENDYRNVAVEGDAVPGSLSSRVAQQWHQIKLMYDGVYCQRA